MLSDLRHAFRSLGKSPGFSATVIVTLALGIGACTTVFVFFYNFLLRPVPFAEPDRLFEVTQDVPNSVGIFAFSGPDYLDVKARARSVDLAVWRNPRLVITGHGPANAPYGLCVEDNFFQVMGAQPILGRTFQPGDSQAAQRRLMVIHHDLWQTVFAGDPGIVGQSVTVSGQPFLVTGVMPPDFDYRPNARIWVASERTLPEATIGQTDFSNYEDREQAMFGTICRLRAGFTREQAEAEMTAILQSLPTNKPGRRSVHLSEIRAVAVQDIRPALTLLLGAVGLLLLIACLNVANLLLSRANDRQRDVAIRLSLGASRRRIARQLLTESLLLAIAGGTAGLVLHMWSEPVIEAMLRKTSSNAALLSDLRFDRWVLTFSLGVTVLTGVLAGLAPLLLASAPDLTKFLREGGRTSSSGPLRRRMHDALVTGEVALSLVLLTSTGLLLRSFWRTQTVDRGVEPGRGFVTSLSFGPQQQTSIEHRRSLYEHLTRRMNEVPGFEASALAMTRLGEIGWFGWPVVPEGYTFATSDETPQAEWHAVSPGYLRTLGIRLRQGRWFDDSDGEDTERVCVVNAAFAQRFFPDESPVGKTLAWGLAGDRYPATIVGVVGNVRHGGPERESGLQVYSPLPQAEWGWQGYQVHVRTALAVNAAEATLRQVIDEFDRDLPFSWTKTFAYAIELGTVRRTIILRVIFAFAGLAVVLAAVGIYAVTTYGVARRTHEIGVRMALGGQARAIVGLVLRQNLAPVALGLALGLGGGVAAALLMRSLLFEIAPLDPATFALVIPLLAAVALLACWLPARRATKVDPLVALRNE